MKFKLTSVMVYEVSPDFYDNNLTDEDMLKLEQQCLDDDPIGYLESIHNICTVVDHKVEAADDNQ